MSDAERYLLCVETDSGQATSICNLTADRLQRNETKLVDVVQSLGEYLTDEDATVRARAVAYYAGVLAAVDANFLTRQQIAVSVQFFGDRINDESGLKEAAQGLKALQKARRFSGDDAIQTVKALFAGAKELRRHPQGTRYVVVTLVDALMSDQRPALKGLRDDFIVGVTDLVNGEKDPRNLMVIFSFLRIVMVEWSIASHVETLFDSVFCYFPITFRPPPGDPYKISTKDLKDRLRDCLASNTLFADYIFPALLDKLDSTTANVKKDVLQTITACALAYEQSSLLRYSSQLWDALKFEILSAQDDDIAEDALMAVATLAERLSSEVETLNAPPNFLGLIVTEAKKLLKEPQQKQAQPIGQILGRVTTASLSACVAIIGTVLPHILIIYQDADAVGKQRELLKVLDLLLESANRHYSTWTSREAPPMLASSLQAFKDPLYAIYTRALMGSNKDEVSLRLVALKGLLNMALLRDYLEDGESIAVVRNFNDILLGEGSQVTEELRAETVRALALMAKTKPSLVMDATIPALLATLPESDKDQSCQYLPGLEMLAQLSVEESLFDVVLRRLLNRLDVVIRNGSTAGYIRAILSTLLFALSQRQLDKDPQLEVYVEKLVVGLIQKVLDHLLNGGSMMALEDESVLHVVGQLANLIVRALPTERQRKMVDIVYSLSYPGFWLIDHLSDEKYKYRRTIILSTYLLASIRREVLIHSDVESLFVKLVRSAAQESVATTRGVLQVHITLLVNKWLLPNHAHAVEESFAHLAGMFNESDNQGVSEEINETGSNSLDTLFWITKAAVLRNAPLSLRFVDGLLELLFRPAAAGLRAARAFQILVCPQQLLRSENGVVIRLLYKQRLFAHCVPQLTKDYRRAADSSQKANHLIALAGLLQYTPTEIILPFLDVLLPLLLQSIDLPNAYVKLATLQVMMVTIDDASAVAEGHVSSLLKRLLACTIVQEPSNPPRVRTISLRCVGLFPKAFRHELLQPHRRSIVNRLVEPLDDPKRDVRKEAVDCRAAWLRMDEEGVD